MTQTLSDHQKARTNKWLEVVLIIALIITLSAGAYLRLVGVNWDENQHMHPDERFLSMVKSAISPVDSISEYFDTANSSLNPANRGFSFFVYGTLPIFINRYIGDALGMAGYGEIFLVGRHVSALFDLMTVLLVFLIGERLYNRWVGLMGSLFYSLAVLPIQLSHYATVDAVTNTFAILAAYAAVLALTHSSATKKDLATENELPTEVEQPLERGNGTVHKSENYGFVDHLYELAPYILFGLALGAATASKINAVVFAVILPLVEAMRYLRMPGYERRQAFFKIIRNLAIAAFLSFLVFRIAQPYAFNGPGFFNMGINENWWGSLQSLRAQSSGDVDFPPALQWARRPITFSWENMVAWGLGWPLGLLAWFAFIGMGVQILKKKNWRKHFPLWVFTGVHFVWQSVSFTRSMRYQVLIYPMLTLFAGWGLVSLWSTRRAFKINRLKIKPGAIRIAGIILAIVIVLSTAAWAYAFSRIYTRPHTRVAASRWIYQNIPGALTLELDTPGGGGFNQPLAYRAGDTFSSVEPYRLPFIGVADGSLLSVSFPHILDQSQDLSAKQISLHIISAEEPDNILGSAWIEAEFPPGEHNWRGESHAFMFEQPVRITEGQLYYLQLTALQNTTEFLLNGSPSLDIFTLDGMALTRSLPRFQQSIRPGSPYTLNTHMLESGLIRAVSIPHLVDLSGQDSLKNLLLTLALPHEGGLSRTSLLEGEFSPGDDVRGDSYIFQLTDPLPVEAGQSVNLTLSTDTEGARLVLYPLVPVLETSWDDAIPYPLDGFNAYNEAGGIYREGLNFEMYWADDAQKLERFERNLDLADYIFITSNRQWGTTTRVPERYLLTTFYYRNLIGCPEDREIIWCYSVAEPGMFEGELGFELIKIFQSDPNIGPIRFNTQFAEEAFTVYDHPKVLIFRKTEGYDPIEVRTLLRSVDLSQVVYFTPAEAASYRGPDPGRQAEPRHNLLLPEDRLADQRQGGTWSELFDQQRLVNQSQLLAAGVFYLFVTLLGVVAYPIVRMSLPGLADRGYPLSKLAGLLLLAFFVWILGSMGIFVTRTLILFVLIGLVFLSIALLLIQKKSLWNEIRANWRYYLMIEGLALVAFVFFALVRAGNPDLWHPFKGGEKPMDLSYLQAVIKSVTFPPFDPWFAGGFINYYYYGFVIVGMPIKLLGIDPTVAYNIVLPIWYSILIIGGFSVGWNLFRGIPIFKSLMGDQHDEKRLLGMAFWVGLITAFGLAVLGNLGTITLMMNGFQRIAAAGQAIDQASLGQQITWTIQGFTQFLQGTPMPFYPGDWYWVPSRVIPGEAITEFPYFTFLYADLHAHLIALPITVFAISWSLSVVLNRAMWGDEAGRHRWLGTGMAFVLGGLVIGSLRPTNTWDFYPYLVFAIIALAYSIFRNYQPRMVLSFDPKGWLEKAGVALIGVLVLTGLSFVLYQPFAYWFGQAYNQINIWEGSRTPLGSYFTHWGLFLFVIMSWMAWETYHWMKTTPKSALKKLDPYLTWIYAILILFFLMMIGFLVMGASVALVVVPLGVWVLALMFQPGITDGRRFLLFMIGTALTLTLAVELVHLQGDIGRMNTVFKFYLQAWVLFALSAGICLGWLIKSFRFWKQRMFFFWQAILFFLIAGTALFTVMGTADKIRDRMAPDAPLGLDGMAYMAEATYFDQGTELQLVEDYRAIRWMQENVEGSPVILEGQAFEYRWGNRYTIYTGLPGVVGWNWHQRQQRAVLRSNVVQARVDAVNEFYQTEDQAFVVDFLDTHDVSYIILGQLERAYYPGPGLEKFQLYDGQLWQEVYRYGSTIIYEVLN